MNIQANVIANFEKALCQIVNQCEREVNDDKFGRGKNPTKEWCHTIDKATGEKNCVGLGTAKAKCCESKVNKRKLKSKTDFSKLVHAEKKIDVPGGGKCIPDVMVGLPPSCHMVYDFKTSCPLTPASKPKWPEYGYDPGQRKPPNPKYVGLTQYELYYDACGCKPKIIHPNSDTCKKAKGEK